MKKRLLAVAIALAATFSVISPASAQTANFIFNDNNGTPNQGTYFAGQSFTFTIDIQFVHGGNISDLYGFSYWFQQSTPSAPFNFAITNRDFTGSQFTYPQTVSLSYPQTLSPSNANDLGASATNTAVGDGTWLVANITVSISPTAANGTYFIENVTSGGKTAVITDDQGHTFAIPQATYEIDVVPEPGTWLGGSLVFATLLLFQRRRILTLGRSLFSRPSA